MTHPGLAALLPDLYPGVFPHLAALVAAGKPRADLEAILLTGIPTGIIAGFTNFTGPGAGAGVTYPLIDTTFKPDAAAGQLTDGLTPASVSDPPLGRFPYLGVPYSGFSNPS